MTTRADVPADTDSAWDGGWHRASIRLESPNHGTRPAPASSSVDLIVVHSISLPPGEYGGLAVQQLFTNTLDWDSHPYFNSIRGLKVSAHFFVDRIGGLWQFVNCDLRAWHAGQSAYRGRPQCNDDSIGIELEGLEGSLFTLPQYTTLTTLCQDIARRYPIAHVAGHEHIAPGRKQDPGPGFDWAHLQNALGWPWEFFPEVTRPTLPDPS